MQLLGREARYICPCGFLKLVREPVASLVQRRREIGVGKGAASRARARLQPRVDLRRYPHVRPYGTRTNSARVRSSFSKRVANAGSASANFARILLRDAAFIASR